MHCVIIMVSNLYTSHARKLNWICLNDYHLYKMAYCCDVYNARHAKRYIYISQHINDVIVTSQLHQTSLQRCFEVTVALLLHYVSTGDGTLNHDIIMFNFT